MSSRLQDFFSWAPPAVLYVTLLFFRHLGNYLAQCFLRCLWNTNVLSCTEQYSIVQFGHRSVCIGNRWVTKIILCLEKYQDVFFHYFCFNLLRNEIFYSPINWFDEGTLKCPSWLLQHADDRIACWLDQSRTIQIWTRRWTQFSS